MSLDDRLFMDGMDHQAVVVPAASKHVMELAEAEVMLDGNGWWYVRPPGGWVQHLNTESHPVELDERGRITVPHPITQGDAHWLLAGSVWSPTSPDSEGA